LAHEPDRPGRKKDRPVAAVPEGTDLPQRARTEHRRRQHHGLQSKSPRVARILRRRRRHSLARLVALPGDFRLRRERLFPSPSLGALSPAYAKRHRLEHGFRRPPAPPSHAWTRPLSLLVGPQRGGAHAPAAADEYGKPADLRSVLHGAAS